VLTNVQLLMFTKQCVPFDISAYASSHSKENNRALLGGAHIIVPGIIIVPSGRMALRRHIIIPGFPDAYNCSRLPDGAMGPTEFISPMGPVKTMGP